MTLKEFHIDISYQDLIEYTGTVQIKAKNKDDAIKRYQAKREKIINNVKWDEESVGDGFNIEIDDIRDEDGNSLGNGFETEDLK